jgi:hypothetical protein
MTRYPRPTTSFTVIILQCVTTDSHAKQAMT